jgi:hypothetical protein
VKQSSRDNHGYFKFVCETLGIEWFELPFSVMHIVTGLRVKLDSIGSKMKAIQYFDDHHHQEVIMDLN